MASFAFNTSKWVMGIASKLIKSDVRMHNADLISDDMAIIFAVNHFTRLETLLLPYELHKHTGREVWSLAASDLFVGKIGEYLSKMGAVSTKDPDRDKVIVHSLLDGNHPWIIFPEGQMIKDKKVVDTGGEFEVFNQGGRRPPHKGIANLALRAEFYRYKLECIYNSPDQEGLEETKERFGIESNEEVEKILQKNTVIVPVNITYYPIRSRDNAILRLAQTIAKDLSPRAIEELSIEGTLLAADTDIDITFGDPIDIQEYLHEPHYAEIMACGDDLRKLELDPKSLFNEAAELLMPRYMEDIYALTRINYDHIFATLIRYQGNRSFTERRYRNRIFLCIHALMQRGGYHLHELLTDSYKAIIYEDPSPKFREFVELSIQEGVIKQHGDSFRRDFAKARGKEDFHRIRAIETTHVIANEVEPVEGFSELVKGIAQSSKRDLSFTIRSVFLEEDHSIFEKDYLEFRSEESKPMDVGRPFLLIPDHFKEGIVLVHGYMAAPKEVRALAEFLYEQGYLVYGVRLKGHGTAPEDLARVRWQDWYESLNRAYVVTKSYTDNIIIGGFSTGGGLALMAAGLKQDKIKAVFSINAPMRLRQFTARLAPSVASINTLLQKIKGKPTGWEFVANSPENEDINYQRNPLSGVRELSLTMEALEEHLPNIVVPTLILQGSNDPTVDPSSGMDLFSKVGTSSKVLTYLERPNHGIINGEGAQDVFNRVKQFLDWAKQQEVQGAPRELEDEIRIANLLTETETLPAS
jgi:esterase/lipase/1-acyl-sn-glycerol-3-phosphate acyltransferase